MCTGSLWGKLREYRQIIVSVIIIMLNFMFLRPVRRVWRKYLSNDEVFGVCVYERTQMLRSNF